MATTNAKSTKKKKTTKKKKVIDEATRLEQLKKKVSIIGIGELGIKALYKLSELNFTLYNTIKFETRDEFKAFNDDYGIYKNDIKKSKMIVLVGDLEDSKASDYIKTIVNDGKSKTNLTVLISEYKFKGMYDELVDNVIYFKQDEIEQFKNNDISDCLGMIVESLLAPTISKSIISLDLNDLMVVLKNKKIYYYSYCKGKNYELINIMNKLIDSLKYAGKLENLVVTFWSNNTLSLLDVYDTANLITYKYTDTTLLVGYTTDIENNKETEITVFAG